MFYTVMDIALVMQQDIELVYRAIRLLKIFKGHRFRKDGKKYIFDEEERRMIEQVMKFGINAARMAGGEKCLA